ncbi:MAG: MerR family transcriptional regulator, partial [Natronosporangium sp.]
MDGWTIDELAERAAEALASEGVRAPNGRVAELPARRVIRWYATIGLLDRPLRTGGRVARYGERHLLQLVAVKRRQAEGYPLAAIQAELAGATDATLRRVA